MSRDCEAHGEDENGVHDFSEQLWMEENTLGDLDLDGRIIWKWCEDVDWIQLAHDRVLSTR